MAVIKVGSDDEASEARGSRHPSPPVLGLVVTSYTRIRTADLLDLISSAEGQANDLEVVAVVEQDPMLWNALIAKLKQSSLRWTALFSDSRLGISLARNLGVDNSRADYIGFVDDDALLDKNWGSEVLKAFDRFPQAIGVTGEVEPLWLGKEPKWFPKSLYWMIGCTAWRGVAQTKFGYFLAGVNMVFKRDAFSLARFADRFTDGAHTEGKLGLPNEDNDFALRLTKASRKLILFEPGVKVYHKIYPFKLTPKYIRRYAFWQGVAEARYNQTGALGMRGQSRLGVARSFPRDILSWYAVPRLCVLTMTWAFMAIGFACHSNATLLGHVRHLI